MIKLESISITQFRGIRDLTLDFRGKNYAICGPNGSGKSGVVDAIEFVLTGRVSRLEGEGRGAVSLKQHGPHVDCRNEPEKATVRASLVVQGMKKSATVERSPKSPGKVEITPKDSEIVDVIRRVETHPEIVLSRRELIRYVLATPGTRSEEVQALLHLEDVERVRASLQKTANECEKRLSAFKATVAQSQDSLLRALGIDELTKDKLLGVANAQRAAIGLAPLADLTPTTSLKEGMAARRAALLQRIPKAQAVADIRAAEHVLADIESAPTKGRVAEALADLKDLAGDPEVSASLKRESFYTAGLELIVAGSCPLCDKEWVIDELKRHVQTKADHLREIAHRRAAAETRLAPIVSMLRNTRAALDTVVRYAVLADPPVPAQSAHDFSVTCGVAVDALGHVLPLEDAIATLTGLPSVPASVLDSIRELEKAVAALPEPTKEDAASEWLTVAQERLQVWRDAREAEEVARSQAKTTRGISETYATASDKVLAQIYSAVEKDFATFYRFINRDDEGKFAAKLTASPGKLGLDVDFYARGLFPPDAYHSEGHQDSMGLCLYLALMRYLHGSDFTFAVLDDVLMSVDAGHRREVCALLRKEFPDTQFIITTHDPIWMRHMKTEGLVSGRSGVQFRGWSVEEGPAQWDDRDVWTEIGDYLKVNEVRAAAALLRHYLEYTSTELCHRLRAPVAFRGDAQYQLGELLPAAIARLRDLYARGNEAANSWNQRDTVTQLSTRAKEFGALAGGSNAEQWQVNVAVHYNSWENLGKADFEPVVAAFRDLLRGFACPDCGEFLRVSPDRETPEQLRCDCNRTSINLLKKP
jgi:recombinational DNA repair ATPase RecF